MSQIISSFFLSFKRKTMTDNFKHKKSAFLTNFPCFLFVNMLKYPHVSLMANINRQQAIDIAVNRTFSYQQIHAKKHYLSSQTRF